MTSTHSKTGTPLLQDHTEAIDLDEKKDYIAFFSKKKKTAQLLIFIHGFHGHGVSTWKNFFTTLRTDKHFKDKDIIFYGYNSTAFQAADHAGDFYDFLHLHALSNSSSSCCIQALKEKKLKERKYGKVTIIAHSLGAIVTREALKTAYDNNCVWLSKVQMALFAPAHMGANIIPLIFETLNIVSITKLLGTFFKYRVPVLNDLEKDSTILTKIMRDTKTLLRNGQGDFTKAKMVAHAKGDKIVQNIKFNQDCDAKRVEGKSHTRVCKPTNDYNEPLLFLKEII